MPLMTKFKRTLGIQSRGQQRAARRLKISQGARGAAVGYSATHLASVSTGWNPSVTVAGSRALVGVGDTVGDDPRQVWMKRFFFL